ncbi:hypothetical protein XPA_010537 [Xanthoria parietina]
MHGRTGIFPILLPFSQNPSFFEPGLDASEGGGQTLGRGVAGGRQTAYEKLQAVQEVEGTCKLETLGKRLPESRAREQKEVEAEESSGIEETMEGAAGTEEAEETERAIRDVAQSVTLTNAPIPTVVQTGSSDGKAPSVAPSVSTIVLRLSTSKRNTGTQLGPVARSGTNLQAGQASV